MTFDPETTLGACLEDYLLRAARGERPSPDEYRERLGDVFGEFRSLIDADAAVESALEAQEAPRFPRAFGPYELLSELGRGGNGIVYLARRDGREVALKVLRRGFVADPVAVERFRREVEILRTAPHPSIVPLLDSGIEAGEPWYAMERIDGSTLEDLRRAGTPPAVRELCAGLAQVADALSHLHARGILHRDVKPSNVLRSDEGRYILCDFGLAHVAAEVSLTRTGDILGTPRYMSPEQVLGDKRAIGPATDLYGLGATLYEVLSGGPLFPAEEWDDLRHDVIHARPAPLPAAAPAGLGALVAAMLSKRPADRPPSAECAAQHLRRLAEDRRSILRGRGGRRLRRLAVAALAMLLSAYAVDRYLHRDARVLIESQPSGAAVAVRGRPIGVTPLRLSLPPGQAGIDLQLEGYERRSMTRTIRPGESVVLRVELVPATGADRAR